MFWRFPDRGKAAAVCFGVSPTAERPPPFVLAFPRPRKGRRRLFWRFPDREILQMF
ncbi:hypothetical protein HMPREF9135_0866 [Segatella baroniae F0067]|uniref:Uncharacterized protein n=1 Tax=Segatella baroniae F0067 TaxID=1115809 RepID=U2P3X9_9BACT|nr:hypothetical protein HMPREF9135_0866 [Segatella baroniae F0067]